MIEVLVETTGTVDGFTYQAHTYYIDEKTGKLVAYAPVDGPFKKFTKPMKFDKRGRRFDVIGLINPSMLNTL